MLTSERYRRGEFLGALKLALLLLVIVAFGTTGNSLRDGQQFGAAVLHGLSVAGLLLTVLIPVGGVGAGVSFLYWRSFKKRERV